MNSISSESICSLKFHSLSPTSSSPSTSTYTTPTSGSDGEDESNNNKQQQINIKMEEKTPLKPSIKVTVNLPKPNNKSPLTSDQRELLLKTRATLIKMSRDNRSVESFSDTDESLSTNDSLLPPSSSDLINKFDRLYGGRRPSTMKVMSMDESSGLWRIMSRKSIRRRMRLAREREKEKDQTGPNLVNLFSLSHYSCIWLFYRIISLPSSSVIIVITREGENVGIELIFFTPYSSHYVSNYP